MRNYKTQRMCFAEIYLEETDLHANGPACTYVSDSGFESIDFLFTFSLTLVV